MTAERAISRKFLVLFIPGIIMTSIGTTLLMAAIWEPNWYGRYTDNRSNIPSNYHFPDWLNYFFIPASILTVGGIAMIVFSMRL